MRLRVAYTDRLSCYAGLHEADANALFARAPSSRHFCRSLRLERDTKTEGQELSVFVGWTGDTAVTPGTIEVSRPFAACMSLAEGEFIAAMLLGNVPVAESVMVKPFSLDDYEVVEINADYIEGHLLAQVAVLSPGMCFPVWVHGSMPVRLVVDARDENTGECFLLSRDSELAIETMRREQGETVFGSPDEKEPRFQLRVFDVAEELDAPSCRVNPQDFNDIAALKGCSVWVAATGGDEMPSLGPVLLRMEASERVPKRHVVVALCAAQQSGIQRFAVVQLWRCRQVPIYVPSFELVPVLDTLRHDGSQEDPSPYQRLFTRLVTRHGELELTDGALIHLGREDSLASEAVPRPASTFYRKTTEDLYEGLSDIDDIYDVPGMQQDVIVSRDANGVYEIDLDIGFEVEGKDGSYPKLSQARLFDTPTVQGEEAVPLCARIRFALGAAYSALTDDMAPPFVRITAQTLAGGISVAKPELARAYDLSKHTESAHEDGYAKPTKTELGTGLPALWLRTPGLLAASMPEESWEDMFQLIAAKRKPASLDELALFSESAQSLRRNILSQLGCLEQSKDGLEPKEQWIRHRQDMFELDDTWETPSPWPVQPSVLSASVAGATAVVGGSGTGKTELCRRVCSEFVAGGAMALQVSCAFLGQPGRKFKVIQDWLRGLFRFAAWHSPSILFFDDFHTLCPDVEPGAPNLSIPEDRSIILAELLLDLLLALRASGSHVAVFATIPRDDSAHRVLWRAQGFEHKVNVRPPMLKERPEILHTLCNSLGPGWRVDRSVSGEGALDAWGSQVDGFSVADLVGLVDRACVEATAEASARSMRGGSWRDITVRLEHLQRAKEGFVPTAMANQSFFSTEVKWSEVGGLEAPKQVLMDMLTMSTKYAVLVDRAPVKPRRGMMLVGPPGCGKTYLVQAAVNETKGLLRWLTVKGPELLSKYIGASEAGVRQKFEQAAAAAPAVIFFDEIESLAPKRGGDSTGVTDRVVNQMLTYLDGVEDRGRVYVVAATSRPDMVDGALMRPGRFDKICYCGLPSEDERLQICEILARKHELVLGAGDVIREQLQQLVQKLPRLFTSADINALFSSAKIEAMNEAMKAADAKTGALAGIELRPTLTLSHLYSALASAKPSISEADERRYFKLFENYMAGAKSPLARTEHERPVATKVALA